MPTRSAELGAAWLCKGGRDLENAHLLIVEQRRLRDIAVYHCQQAGEKALKAYLTAKETIFPKTHSLGKLLDLCIPIEPRFAEYRRHADELTPLADEFRYPGDATEPTDAEAEEALALAEEIYRFCEQQLGNLESGGKSNL